MCPIVSEARHQEYWLLRMRPRILVFLTASLASTILLKIAEIQILELIFLVDLLFVLWTFVRGGLRVEVFRPYFSIALCYGIFIFVAIILSVYGLRQNLYPYGPTSFLKRPLVMTLSRSAELFLDVFYMLYLANLYRKDKGLCEFGMKTYYWFGIASAVYSVVSYPFNVLYQLNLGTYFEDHRARGFYNEGGPYGVYLISLVMLTAVMYRRGWLTRAQYGWGMSSFALCMVMSQSKSALAFLLVLFLIDAYLLSSAKGRFVLTTVLMLAVVVALSVGDVGRWIEAYEVAAYEYRVLSQIKSDDGNYVMGRVAGAVLAPRIIAAHPLAGIGWGNYGLIRDDPEYRQGSAFSLGSDAPGLGPIDYIVDLGIPLWLYLGWVELRPFQYLRRNRSGLLLLNLALMQPMANIFGAHLNLTYPWVVGGFALGLGFKQSESTGATETEGG